MAVNDDMPSFEQFAAQYGYNTDTTLPSVAHDETTGMPGFEDFARSYGYEMPLDRDPMPSFQEFAARYGYNLGPPPETAAPAEEDGEFFKGIKRGGLHVGAFIHGTGAAIGDVFGFEEFTQNRINDYLRLTKEAEQYAAKVASVEEIDSPGKFISWAAGLLGEQIPIMATVVMGGGATGLISRLVAKKAITNLTGQALAAKVSAWTGRGLTAGTIGTAGTIEAGGIAGEQIESGQELRGGVALTSGLAAGSLEAFAPLAIMRYFNLGKPAATSLVDSIKTHLAGKGLASRMATLAGFGAGTESLTESAQEVIAIAARKYVDENYDTLGEETSSRILNAAAGGLLFGLVFGGLGGIPRTRAPEQALGGETDEGAPTTPPPTTPPSTTEGAPTTESAAAAAASEPGPHVELVTDRAVEPIVKTTARFTQAESALAAPAIILNNQRTPATQPLVDDVLKTDPQAHQLLVTRNSLLKDPNSYTEKQGGLTKQAQDMLQTLENDLLLRAQELGVDAPTFPALPTLQNLKEGSVSKLTPGERRQLAKLEELEQSPDGLNDRQYERLEKLRAKAEGEVDVERQHVTQDALDEIDAEVRNQMLASQAAARQAKISENLEQKLAGPLYGGAQRQSGRGITQAQFDEAVQGVRLENEGNIRLINHPNEIPHAQVREEVRKSDAAGFNTQAVYVPWEDTTYFFLDRIGSNARAVAMYLHEVMVHHGLRTLPEHLRTRIISLVKRDHLKTMQAIADTRGIEWDPNNDKLMTDLAEEVLATLAEKNDFNMPLWKRVVAAIKAWVRRFTGLSLSENDLRYILYSLQRRLSRKATPKTQASLNTISLNPSLYFGFYEGAQKWQLWYPQMVMRFIDKLPEQDMMTRVEAFELLETVRQKKPVFNKQEKAVVLEALSGLKETFMRSELEEAIRSKLVPMYVEDISNTLDLYEERNVPVADRATDITNARLRVLKSWGLKGIGLEETTFQTIEELDDVIEPKVLILRFDDSVQVPRDMNHFRHEHYAAHVRGFRNRVIHRVDASGRPMKLTNDFYVTEVQSDMAQKARVALTPEQLLALKEREARLQAHTDIIQPLLQRMDNYVQMGTGENPVDLMDEASGALNALEEEFPMLVSSLYTSARDSEGLAVWTPGMFVDILDQADDELVLRLTEVGTTLAADQYSQDSRGLWDQEGPKLYHRAIESMISWAADNNFNTLNLADADTVAKVEGWVLGNDDVNLGEEEIKMLVGNVLNPADISDTKAMTFMDLVSDIEMHTQEGRMTTANRFAGIIQDRYPGGIKAWIAKFAPANAGLYRRHQELYKRFQREHNTREVTKGTGTFAQMDITPDMRETPVTVLFGGVKSESAVRAERMGAPQDVVEAVEAMASPWKTNLFTKVLTLVQITRKFKLPQLQKYVDRITQWAAEKMELVSQAETVIAQWRALGKQDAAALTRAIFAITQKSDEEHRKLTHEEKMRIFKAHKMSDEAIVVYGLLEQTFADVRRRMKLALFYNRARIFFDRDAQGNLRPDAEDLASKFRDTWDGASEETKRKLGLDLEKEGYDAEVVDKFLHGLNEIEHDMRQLEHRDYFPYKRFGKHTIKIRATQNGQRFGGKNFEANDIVAFYTFENPTEQKAFFDSPQLKEWRRTGEYEVSMGVMRDKEMSLADMPFNFISTLEESGKLNLTFEQKKELRQIAYQYAPGRSFLQHMQNRAGIQGMSLDAMRVFGTYMQSAANHIARSKYYIDMGKDLQALDTLRDQFEVYAGDTRGLDILQNSLQKHREYIMNPGQEWAAARAVGFTFFLGFNIKSAVINFTQIPMVTYPYLAERYGAGRAFNMLMGSMKEATLAFNPKTMNQKLPPYLDELLARAIREGFIDEAMAVELAGVAQGPLLERVIPTSKANRAVSQFAYYAATPFRFTEKLTRRVAFIAAVKLARANGADMEEAYIAGREAVRATLFEYAKWNRPEFMRGRKSVFFLFWTFMQHMAFTLFGGQGAKTAMGVWMMLLLAGGMQGLPFVENLLDIIDWSSTKVKTALGMKNPHTDLRLRLREIVATFSDTPDLWMHGLSRYYGLGPLHLLDALGAPIPNLDVSGSVTMGRILPGTQEAFGPANSVDEKLGRTLMDIAGPVFGIGYGLAKAFYDDNPDSWKRWERAMPSAMKAASRAMRLGLRGQEEFSGGGAVVKFDPHNTEHTMELIGQAFAFTPTRLNQRYELRAHQEDLKEFLLSWRQRLLTQWDYARRTNDREGEADMRKAIRDFNHSVPDHRLRITTQTMTRSAKERLRRRESRELGIPVERGLRSTFSEIQEAFPEVTPGT